MKRNWIENGNETPDDWWGELVTRVGWAFMVIVPIALFVLFVTQGG